ncbi:MAG: hypothetical protein ACXWPM_02740 [Bdellovibrionota bacterium]
MSSSSTTTYLSKSGKIEGPFSPTQIEEMRRSGELSAYFWRWDAGSKEWAPLHPPPPRPPEQPQAAAEPPRAVAAARPTAARAPVQVSPGILAVCFDARTVASGAIADIGDGGCLLTQVHPAGDFPVFRRGATLTLNLLDEATSRSENVKAVVDGAEKRGGSWEYRLKWPARPQLIAKL